MKYRKYAKQINELTKRDQDLRSVIFSKDNITDKEKKELTDIDAESTTVLKEIVANIGAPTITKLGKTGSFNAWLLVQHSPDLEFQKEYLKLLKDNKDDVTLSNIAYLEDRILMYENKPQIYGTQFRYDETTNTYKPYQIQDEKDVNKRRDEYGMETLEEHIAENYSD